MTTTIIDFRTYSPSGNLRLEKSQLVKNLYGVTILNIKTEYPDGQFGDLILSMPPNLKSRGIKTLTSNIHMLQICINSPTERSVEEQKFIDVFDTIVEECKNILSECNLSNNVEIINPQCQSNGNYSIYTKLLFCKDESRIITPFRDQNDNHLEPKQLGKSLFTGNFAVKLQFIFLTRTVARFKIMLHEVNNCKVFES
jgi:hypothetical protein